MSRTFRLIGFKNGKPDYSKHINQVAPYRFYRHENVNARKKYYRGYRIRQKQFLKKFNEHLKFRPTNGWRTW